MKENSVLKNKKIIGLGLIMLTIIFICSMMFVQFLLNPFYLVLMMTIIPLFGDLGTFFILFSAVFIFYSWFIHENMKLYIKDRMFIKSLLIFGTLLFICSLTIPANSEAKYFGILSMDDLSNASGHNIYANR